MAHLVICDSCNADIRRDCIKIAADGEVFYLDCLIRRTRHNQYPVPDWVHQQVYLHPYPEEPMLRNHL